MRTKLCISSNCSDISKIQKARTQNTVHNKWKKSRAHTHVKVKSFIPAKLCETAKKIWTIRTICARSNSRFLYLHFAILPSRLLWECLCVCAFIYVYSPPALTRVIHVITIDFERWSLLLAIICFLSASCADAMLSLLLPLQLLLLRTKWKW